MSLPLSLLSALLCHTNYGIIITDSYFEQTEAEHWNPLNPLFLKLTIDALRCNDYQDCTVNCYGKLACHNTVIYGPFDARLTVNCHSVKYGNSNKGFACRGIEIDAQNSIELLVNVYNENGELSEAEITAPTQKDVLPNTFILCGIVDEFNQAKIPSLTGSVCGAANTVYSVWGFAAVSWTYKLLSTWALNQCSIDSECGSVGPNYMICGDQYEWDSCKPLEVPLHLRHFNCEYSPFNADPCYYEGTYPPTNQPTAAPTPEPTAGTAKPTPSPTSPPTNQPSSATKEPTKSPTERPTKSPTDEPTKLPSAEPSHQPTTSEPSTSPVTLTPSKDPTTAPVEVHTTSAGTTNVPQMETTTASAAESSATYQTETTTAGATEASVTDATESSAAETGTSRTSHVESTTDEDDDCDTDDSLDRDDCDESDDVPSDQCSVLIAMSFDVCYIEPYEQQRDNLWINTKECACNDIFGPSEYKNDGKDKDCYIKSYESTLLNDAYVAYDKTESDHSACEMQYTFSISVSIYNTDCQYVQEVARWLLDQGDGLALSLSDCNLALSTKRHYLFPAGFGRITNEETTVKFKDEKGDSQEVASGAASVNYFYAFMYYMALSFFSSVL